MRLSTSPSIIRSQMTRNVPQYYDVQQSNRSNSLSQLSLHSPKFHTKTQSPKYSPYYNQNSQIRIVSPQQINLQSKSVPTMYANNEGLTSLQLSIKKLSQKLQNIEKRLKKQETQITSIKKTNQQRSSAQKIQQKISQQTHKKILTNYQNLCQQFKQIDSIFIKSLAFDMRKQQKDFLAQNKRQFQHSQFMRDEKSNIQKKIANIIIEDKIKQEISKLQNHLNEQIKKCGQKLKKDIENALTSNQFGLYSRSKLKYKLRPLQISVRNEVSINKNFSQLKNSKNLSSLSTAYSSGSSQQSDFINSAHKRTISIQQQTYYIDQEGYLLDQSGYYLLNEKQKMIKIDKSIIKKLQQIKLLD